MLIRRALSSAAVAATLVGSALVAMPPAQAANNWMTVMSSDRGKLQMCRTVGPNGNRIVRARVDNSRADHLHIAGVTRMRGNVRKEFNIGAGRISRTVTFQVRAGDNFGFGITHPGQGLGDGMRLGDIGRC